MLTRKEAEEQAEHISNKNINAFQEEIEPALNELAKFIPEENLDRYLNELVQENIQSGIAEYKLSDYLNRMSLKDKWKKEEANLESKYPHVFSSYERSYNMLEGHFDDACRRFVKKNGYQVTTPFSQVFGWIPDGNQNDSFKLFRKAWLYFENKREREVEIHRYFRKQNAETEKRRQEAENDKNVQKVVELITERLDAENDKNVKKVAELVTNKLIEEYHKTK